MNILFITLCNVSSINDRNIYTDLLRQFCLAGHKVFVMAPNEKETKKPVLVIAEGNSTIYKIKVGTIQKTNVIRKGINMIRMERIFKRQYDRYLNGEPIDVVLYSTPPITLYKLIAYVKKKQNAFAYLLLKDIFPQNAVDLHMMPSGGIIYSFFRRKEMQVYKISDYIGCMSQANVDYILRHNPYLPEKNVGVSPNCLEAGKDVAQISFRERQAVRQRYGIPSDRRVYLYGGNLGKPQDIAFIIKCLRAVKAESENYFVICGSGTEYGKLERYMESDKPPNVKLIAGLPYEEYNLLVKACDIGMLFLDYRFTIPNFPSRILSYMEYALPVLACTDINTDIGKTIEEGDFGWWCPSNSADEFVQTLHRIDGLSDEEIRIKGINGKKYLDRKYDVKVQYTQMLEVIRG